MSNLFNNTFNLKQEEKENLKILLEEVKLEHQELDKLSDDALKSALQQACYRLILMRKMDFSEKNFYVEKLFNRLRGHGPLQHLLEDPEITEIMVNGPQQIFIEKNGKLYKSSIYFNDEQDLNDKIQQLFAKQNKRIDGLTPIADTLLDDGSRVNAILSPISKNGSSLTIRKFCGIKPTQEALLENQSLTQSCLNFLKNCVLNKESIFICGGTGVGKTTLLNVLSTFILQEERIVTIEDTAELELLHPHWVRLEARQGQLDGLGEISIARLIQAALRMRPDRLIVGEIRGQEAAQLIHAANTGHPGSLCTGHANSCEDMVRRLCNLILEHSRLPYSVILENIASAFPYFVFLKRSSEGKRFVHSISGISEIKGDKFKMKTFYSAKVPSSSKESLSDTWVIKEKFKLD